MNTAILSLGITGLILSSSAFALPLNAPTVPIDGVTVNHQAGSVVREDIPLTKLSHDFWNISCDYKVQETGGAAPPSISSPFAVKIGVVMHPEASTISGSGYTTKGLTASIGTLVFDHVDSHWGDNSLYFENYDMTGDLIISNCIATMQL
jgi:hypothetical protein